MKQLTEKQRKEIVEKYLDGQPSTKLSLEYNVSPNTILYTVKRSGNNTRTIKEASNKILSPSQIEQVVQDYYSGMSITQLSLKYKCAKFPIFNYLKNNKVKMRPAGGIRKYEVDHNYFSSIDTEEKAYFLGFLYADGNVSKDLNVVEMSLQEPDKDVLQKLNDFIQPQRPLSFRKARTTFKNRPHYKYKNQFRMFIRSRKICQDLVKLGCVPQKTFILKFPNLENKELIAHFIRGYIDGDGSISKNSVGLTSSTQFVEDFSHFIKNKFNIHCCISKHSTSQGVANGFISGRLQCIQFLDWMYKDATIFLERKYLKYQEMKNFQYSENYRKPVFNPDGTKLTDDQKRIRCNQFSKNYRQKKKEKLKALL